MRHYRLFNIESNDITKHTCFKKLKTGNFFVKDKIMYLVKGELPDNILLVQIMDYNRIREELTRVLNMSKETED